MTEFQTAAENKERAQELLGSPGWEWFARRMKDRQDKLVAQIFADSPGQDDLDKLRAGVIEWRVIQDTLAFPQVALENAVRKVNEGIKVNATNS